MLQGASRLVHAERRGRAVCARRDAVHAVRQRSVLSRAHPRDPARDRSTRYKPEGFTDNSWSGLSRANICFCDNCRAKFRTRARLRSAAAAPTGTTASTERGSSGATRAASRSGISTTRPRARPAGPACLWVGMIGGTVSGVGVRVPRLSRDLPARRADHARQPAAIRQRPDFRRTARPGSSFTGSSAGTSSRRRASRCTRRPAPRSGCRCGPSRRFGCGRSKRLPAAFSRGGTTSTCTTKIGGCITTPVAMADWHTKNEQYLGRRQPVATVGIVYSQRNHDFFGRDDSELIVESAAARLPAGADACAYSVRVRHADDIERDAAGLRVAGAAEPGVDDRQQIAAVRAFATPWRRNRRDRRDQPLRRVGRSRARIFALADLFGVSLPSSHPLRDAATRRQAGRPKTYRRICVSTPELRAKTGRAAHRIGASSDRHTSSDPERIRSRPTSSRLAARWRSWPSARTRTVLMTYVPPRPAFPPEAVWSREDRTDIAGLVVNERVDGSRVAYLAADLDRRYARDNISDTGNLLANIVRWAAQRRHPVEPSKVPGLLDCHLYQQPGRHDPSHRQSHERRHLAWADR